MGKIILTVEGSSVGTVAEGRGIVVTKEVSEQDSARLIMAYARSYRDRFVNANGEPRQPSVEEVVTAWFDGIVAGSIAHVENVERDIKAEEARRSIKTISVS